MIVTGLLTILTWIMGIMFFLLPDSEGLPDIILTGVDFLMARISGFDSILPVYDIILIIQLWFGFYLAVSIYNTINWIIGKLRGSN